MKKKKTENPAENNAAESKSRVEAITEPAESVDAAEESDLSKVVFKKAFQGYNIADVDEYIDSQNQYHASTCAMYDEKLSELRSEVSLLNRERESLLSKIEVLQAELDKALSGETEKAQEIPLQAEQPKEIIVSGSSGDNSALAAENAGLKSRVAELTYELKEQKIINDELSGRVEELDKSKAEIFGLRNEIAGLNNAVSEKNERISQLEGVETELAGLRDDYGKLDKLYNGECEKREKAENALNEKSELLTAGEKEQSRLRKELSDSEIRQTILHQQLKKSYDELDELRETNRAQAYEYADKLSKLQADFAAEKINLKKQLQFHLFHIRQVGELLDEVKKEYDEAEASLKDFEAE